MGKRGMDGISLWGCMKVRYNSASKLEPLCHFYRENIRLLKLKVNRSLVGFVERFQGLSILQQETDSNADSEYQLVFQMVEHI